MKGILLQHSAQYKKAANTFRAHCPIHRKLGGPIFNIEYYISKAKRIEEMGAHSLCIKDMAGIISPYDAYELISALKKILRYPYISIHIIQAAWHPCPA